MSNAPLMPKATAVWLVDNTALTFDQVADFTKMHPLEVRAIADGDAAQGIKGMDPISTGQLTREEIEKGERDPNYRLRLQESKVVLPPQPKRKGPRYTPVSRRHERPSAILWLVRNHPELKDAQIMRLVGTTKTTIASVRDRTQRRRRVRQAQDHRRQEARRGRGVGRPPTVPGSICSRSRSGHRCAGPSPVSSRTSPSTRSGGGRRSGIHNYRIR